MLILELFIGLFIGFITGFLIAVILVMADDVKRIKELKKIRQILLGKLNKTNQIIKFDGAGEIIEVIPDEIRKAEEKETFDKLYG